MFYACEERWGFHTSPVSRSGWLLEVRAQTLSPSRLVVCGDTQHRTLALNTRLLHSVYSYPPPPQSRHASLACLSPYTCHCLYESCLSTIYRIATRTLHNRDVAFDGTASDEAFPRISMDMRRALARAGPMSGLRSRRGRPRRGALSRPLIGKGMVDWYGSYCDVNA